ncbi:MAG: hypothetical protein LBG20_03085 [Holosporaceae bacterium]|nr:hypothetical protein [Holosporaceae bacterium]
MSTLSDCASERLSRSHIAAAQLLPCDDAGGDESGAKGSGGAAAATITMFDNNFSCLGASQT